MEDLSSSEFGFFTDNSTTAIKLSVISVKYRRVGPGSACSHEREYLKQAERNRELTSF
jgi:hypothetical protein